MFNLFSVFSFFDKIFSLLSVFQVVFYLSVLLFSFCCLAKRLMVFALMSLCQSHVLLFFFSFSTSAHSFHFHASQCAKLSRRNRLLSLNRHPAFQGIRGSHTFSSFSSLNRCIIEEPIPVQPPVAACRCGINQAL